MIAPFVPHRVRARRGERGFAELIEFALCVPIIAILLIGVMMTGMLLFSYHSLSELAREGTRYAIVRGSQCSSFSSACPASRADIQSYVRQQALSPLKPNSMTVNATWSGPYSPANSPGNTVTVTVSYPFALNVPFVPSQTIHLTSTSAMVISQ